MLDKTKIETGRETLEFGLDDMMKLKPLSAGLISPNCLEPIPICVMDNEEFHIVFKHYSEFASWDCFAGRVQRGHHAMCAHAARVSCRRTY